jgi:DNA-binding beta-propeller fold protein YncE
LYYPPPPEEPRLQFLTSYSEASDVAPQSRFARFIVGKAPRRAIGKPYGVGVARDRIFVCDTGAHAIEILDLRKPKMTYFAPEGAGQFRVPVNIAVDTNGTRYVADTGRGQVLIYSADGTYLAAIGRRATGAGTNDPGMEIKPAGVLVTTNRLYVTDMKGRSVRVYDKASHELQFTIPRGEKNDASKLFQPTNIAGDPQGRIYVCDTGGFRVQQYDAEGVYLRTFGLYGDSPGQFARPKGVAVDHEGRVYVVDAKSSVIQIFDSEGKLLLFFGEPGGSKAPLYLPASVAVDYENVDLFQKYAAPGFKLEYLVIVSNQYGKRKISVYGFGHKR